MSKIDLYLMGYIIAFAIIGVAYINNNNMGNNSLYVLAIIILCIPLIYKCIIQRIFHFMLWIRFLPSEMGVPGQQIDIYVRFLRSGRVSIFDTHAKVRTHYEEHFNRLMKNTNQGQHVAEKNAASRRPSA